MLKSIVVGLVGTLVSLAPGMAQAQTQPPSPQVLSQSFSPGRASTTITPLELQQFIQALRQLQRVDMETQEKLVEALKSENLSPQRFQEIGQKQNNPDIPGVAPVSAAEQQRFEKAIAKIQTIREEAAPKQSRAITLQGLTVERFNQIGVAIEQNPDLRRQIQNRLQ